MTEEELKSLSPALTKKYEAKEKRNLFNELPFKPSTTDRKSTPQTDHNETPKPRPTDPKTPPRTSQKNAKSTQNRLTSRRSSKSASNITSCVIGSTTTFSSTNTSSTTKSSATILSTTNPTNALTVNSATSFPITNSSFTAPSSTTNSSTSSSSSKNNNNNPHNNNTHNKNNNPLNKNNHKDRIQELIDREMSKHTLPQQPKPKQPQQTTDYKKLYKHSSKQTLYHTKNLSLLLGFRTTNKIPSGLTVNVETKEKLSPDHKKLWDETTRQASDTLHGILIEHHQQHQQKYQEQRLEVQKHLSEKEIETIDQQAEEEVFSKPKPKLDQRRADDRKRKTERRPLQDHNNIKKQKFQKN